MTKEEIMNDDSLSYYEKQYLLWLPKEKRCEWYENHTQQKIEQAKSIKEATNRTIESRKAYGTFGRDMSIIPMYQVRNGFIRL